MVRTFVSSSCLVLLVHILCIYSTTAVINEGLEPAGGHYPSRISDDTQYDGGERMARFLEEPGVDDEDMNYNDAEERMLLLSQNIDPLAFGDFNLYRPKLMTNPLLEEVNTVINIEDMARQAGYGSPQLLRLNPSIRANLLQPALVPAQIVAPQIAAVAPVTVTETVFPAYVPPTVPVVTKTVQQQYQPPQVYPSVHYMTSTHIETLTATQIQSRYITITQTAYQSVYITNTITNVVSEYVTYTVLVTPQVVNTYTTTATMASGYQHIAATTAAHFNHASALHPSVNQATLLNMHNFVGKRRRLAQLLQNKNLSMNQLNELYLKNRQNSAKNSN